LVINRATTPANARKYVLGSRALLMGPIAGLGGVNITGAGIITGGVMIAGGSIGRNGGVTGEYVNGRPANVTGEPPIVKLGGITSAPANGSSGENAGARRSSGFPCNPIINGDSTKAISGVSCSISGGMTKATGT
jgi:hypothetical protein